MSGVNKVILLGRLGRDPELRTTTSGNSVCNFSVATSENWNDKQTGEKQERTEWHNIVVWGKLAEICAQYLSKGAQAYIEGKLQTTKYTDKENVERYKTEVVAQTVQFIGGKSDSNTPASAASALGGRVVDDDNSIPF